MAPDSYIGRTLTITTNDGVPIILSINPLISNTIGTLTVGNREPSLITEFRLTRVSGYGATLLVFSQDLVPFRFTLGYDSATSGRATGTASTVIPTPLSGTFELSPQ